MARNIELAVKFFDPETGKEVRRDDAIRKFTLSVRLNKLLWFAVGFAACAVLHLGAKLWGQG